MEKKVIRLIVITIFLAVFLSIGYKIKGSKEGIYFDEKILDKTHRKVTNNKTKFMKFITFFGSYKFFLFAGFLIIFILLRRKSWISIFLLILSTLGSLGLNSLLKHYYVRVRPIQYFLVEKTGYSYPSGHAMVSMTFYTVLTYLISENLIEKRKRIFLWVLNFIIIILIGYSRIYLGVHWPTDIIGGYILGGLLSYVIILSGKKIESKLKY